MRNELKDVECLTLTTLMLGATDTEFFARADMVDTRVGQDGNQADPAKVAKDGGDALMRGKSHIAWGLSNKMQVPGAGVLPQAKLAERHRKMAEPGRGED